MENSSQDKWPFLRVSLPKAADGEQIGILSQVAADVGALGAVTEPEALTFYLPREADEDFVEEVCQAVQAEADAFGWPILLWQVDSLLDQPWATAWKKDFKTFPVGQSLLIRPDWEHHEPAPPEWSDRLPIWLRPGFGFGTGRHETTRLALEMLENHLEPGARVLDFGSGSGVLSIAAIRLGAASATAVEFDPDANQNARENFELNGCTARVYLHESNDPSEAPGHFELIICNMLPHNALPHFLSLVSRLEKGAPALFIYSGFLVEQREQIEEALSQSGMVAQGFAKLNEWGAIVAECSHARI